MWCCWTEWRHSVVKGIQSLCFASNMYILFIMLLALPHSWNQVFPFTLGPAFCHTSQRAIPLKVAYEMEHALKCVVSLLPVKQKGLNGFAGAFSNKIKYVGHVFLPKHRPYRYTHSLTAILCTKSRDNMYVHLHPVRWRGICICVHTCVMSARVFMHILRTVVMQIDPAAEGQVWFPLRALRTRAALTNCIIIYQSHQITHASRALPCLDADCYFLAIKPKYWLLKAIN